MKIYQWVCAIIACALLMFGCSRVAPAQASPYNLFIPKPQNFTATAQCGTIIQTNGLSTNASTIGSSYTSVTVTLTGTGLTTASFQIQGSFDNGATFYPLPFSPVSSPTSISTTVTITANAAYQGNLTSVTQIKACTTGTFTAASVTLTFNLTPNGVIARSSGGSGGPPSGGAGGCLGAFYPNPDVTCINGVVIAGTPTQKAVPVATDSTHSTWTVLTADDIAPGFSITLSGGGNVEIGATITNPAFTATYSSTPASAAITNTDSISSPTNLSTPFTSATITGNFQHTSAATTTFTLTAIGPVTKTATAALLWLPRTFGGVGAAGATSSVTASTTTAVLSNSAVLASAGLSNQATYGAYSPSAQKIYILMTGGAHTFKDAATGFSFAFNSPTSVSFVNVNGSTVAMFLYESTNTLTGTFSITVAS